MSKRGVPKSQGAQCQPNFLMATRRLFQSLNHAHVIQTLLRREAGRLIFQDAPAEMIHFATIDAAAILDFDLLRFSVRFQREDRQLGVGFPG